MFNFQTKSGKIFSAKKIFPNFIKEKIFSAKKIFPNFIKEKNYFPHKD